MENEVIIYNCTCILRNWTQINIQLLSSILLELLNNDSLCLSALIYTNFLFSFSYLVVQFEFILRTIQYIMENNQEFFSFFTSPSSLIYSLSFCFKDCNSKSKLEFFLQVCDFQFTNFLCEYASPSFTQKCIYKVFKKNSAPIWQSGMRICIGLDVSKHLILFTFFQSKSNWHRVL